MSPLQPANQASILNAAHARTSVIQVEKLHEEGPQLKLLQTSLTLLQSPALIQNEVSKNSDSCGGLLFLQLNLAAEELYLIELTITLQDAIAAVLGICFRSLANSKNTDSVVSTAAATVRQVMDAPHNVWLSSCLHACFPVLIGIIQQAYGLHSCEVILLKWSLAKQDAIGEITH